MSAIRKKLGEILVERKIVDRHQLKLALDHQQKWPKKLGEILIDLQFIGEEALVKVLSEYFRVPAIDVDKFPVDRNALVLVKPEFCREHGVFPIAIRKIKGQNKLIVATADPSDVASLDELRFNANMPIAVAITSMSAVKKAVQTHYFGEGAIDRDEITITTTVRPEDAMMEIIRAGDQDKIVFEPTAYVPSGNEAFKALIHVLSDKGVLNEKEAGQILKLVK